MKIFSIGPKSASRMASVAYVGILVSVIGAFAYDAVPLSKQSVQARVIQEVEFQWFVGRNEGHHVVTVEVLSGEHRHQQAQAQFFFKNSTKDLSQGTVVEGQLTQSRLFGRWKLKDVQVVNPSSSKPKM